MQAQGFTLFVFTIVAWITTTAQPSQSAFLHYTSDNGLSSDHITGIVKDRLGFLWVSTVNGLNRFDGRTIKVFRHIPDDTNSIPNNYIRGISLSPDGRLWIATMGGLCIMDPLWLEIRRITMPENLDTLNNDATTLVAFDSKGIAWTTGNNGIYSIDPVALQVKEIYPTVQPSWGWFGMMIDRMDRLWLIRDTLRRFDPATRQVKFFDGIDPAESLVQAGCLSLVTDEAGRIWAGTWGMGIWEYVSAADEFRKVPFSESLAMMVAADDEAGRKFLWVGGGASGLGVFYPDTKEFIPFTPDPEDPFTHNNYLVKFFYKDNTTGDVWMATEIGLEHYAPAAIRFGRAKIPADKDMGQFSLVSGVVHDQTDLEGGVICQTRDPEGHL